VYFALAHTHKVLAVVTGHLTGQFARVCMCMSEIYYGYSPTLLNILSKDKIMSLLQKSPTKETIFCRKSPMLYVLGSCGLWRG